MAPGMTRALSDGVATQPTPNYINPEEQGVAIFVIIGIFGTIAILTIVARIYSRLVLTRAQGIDDIVIVAGLCFTVALSVMVMVDRVENHSGRHVWDIPPTALAPIRRNLWISEWLYLAASACIKTSILLFYRRLSVSFSKQFKIAVKAGIAYVVLTNVGFAICLIVVCRPLYAYWTSYDPVWAVKNKGNFYCSSEKVVLPLSGILNVLGDLYSTVLPMIVVESAAKDLRQKMALYGLFALGFLSVAAGTVRTVYLSRLAKSHDDFTYGLSATWPWTMIELYIAIFAASGPALKPFFARFLVQKLKNIGSNSRSAGYMGQRSANRASAHPGQKVIVPRFASSSFGIHSTKLSPTYEHHEQDRTEPGRNGDSVELDDGSDRGFAQVTKQSNF